MGMEGGKFIRFVGPSQVHDVTIVAVERYAESVTVKLLGYNGGTLALIFSGVTAMKSLRSEGMLFYSLSELEDEPSYRRFVFASID